MCSSDLSPIAEVTDERGVRHAFWRVPDPTKIVQLFTKVSRAYIADGHHRAAAAARLAKEKPGPQGILTVFFPASELKILPYHRLVLNLDPLNAESLLAAARKSFAVTELSAAPNDETGKLGLFVGNRWYQLA